MTRFRDKTMQLLAMLLVCLALCVSAGCSTVKVQAGPLPPVLGQDEVMCPYEKVATVRVHRSRYGDPEDMPPLDYNWAYDALREEARRIGADAVIYPEVSVELHRYIFFPTSEITAKGIAIKFK